MKIIQSFAKFEEGSPYLKTGDERYLLKFYTYLLSCLSIQKNCGNITMFCNKKAYDSLIKYIPYHEVNILENNNTFEYWNFYKIDVMKLMNEKFIHTDSDVFIFNSLFSSFFSNEKYDVIIQDVLPYEKNMVNGFVNKNSKVLKEYNIFDSNEYDGCCCSCGTVGMKINVRDEYVEIVDSFKILNKNNKFINVNPIGMIGEELMLYLLLLKKKYKYYEILSKDLIKTYGMNKAGSLVKYTHMWIDTKYNLEYVKLIKNKILKEYSDYSETVFKYERDVLKK